jgi:hypothetical protein
VCGRGGGGQAGARNRETGEGCEERRRQIFRTNSIEVSGGVTAGEGSACVYKVRMCPSFGWLAARQVAWMEVLGAVVLSEGHSRMLPCTPAIDCVVPRLCLLLQLQQHLCGMPLLG